MATEHQLINDCNHLAQAHFRVAGNNSRDRPGWGHQAETPTLILNVMSWICTRVCCCLGRGAEASSNIALADSEEELRRPP